jgi:hypothetical protein
MGLANTNVTVSFDPGLPGECVPATLTELTARLTELVSTDVEATGDMTFYNFGDTEPAPENRIYPWLRTVGGYPDKWYVWVGAPTNAWVAVNPSHIWYSGSASGAANAYTANTAEVYPSTTALTVGDVFLIRINVTNTLASTLAINGLAAAVIQNGGTNVVAGALVAGQTYMFMWDGVFFRVLNATIPDRTPVSVYATSASTATGTTNIDLSLTLPAGKTTWRTIQMYATAYADSKAADPSISITVTFKWNAGSLLNTAVTTGSATGAGNSGQVLSYTLPDVQGFPHFQWEGVVPVAIQTTSPLIVRATLTLTEVQDPGTWIFWAVAIST